MEKFINESMGENMRSTVPRSVGTHSGTFHADEVTACALLLLFQLVDRDKIVRTRDPEKLRQCEYVCDVGGVYDPDKKLFDHHQADYSGLLSSAGMVLAYLLRTGKMSEDCYRFFNNALILGVDDWDNGRVQPIPGYCFFSHVIANFVPVEHEAGDLAETKAFFEALDFVFDYLTRLLERFNYTRRCREIVAESMKKYGECLFFEKSIPWVESFFELEGERHPALFVIMPAGDHWKLRGVPPSYERRMQVRVPLPEKWAGLLQDDLKRVSGIPGAIFCHKGRFISVWETKADALKALEYTLKHRVSGKEIR